MNNALFNKAKRDVTQAGEIVFQTIGLAKVYDMGAVKVHALRGIDLELYAGELVVLLGPSCSGKSTLLNILGGLDTATGGTVMYRGQDLTRASERELTEYRRYHVGFVFQFYNLIPSLTARENVAAVTEIARDPMKPEEALSIVNLGDGMDHFPSQLSGGEQQRVAIGMDKRRAKGPTDWREARRVRAWELKQAGWKQKDIAAALGVSQAAVSDWMRRGREGGPAALRNQPKSGAPRRLSDEQVARLPELLKLGAEHFGFRGEVWTRKRVAGLIERAFGVRYSSRHVGRLLETIRWSSQKPVERASQRNEAAIEQWRVKTWPTLQKKPSGKGAR